ncbi:MAG TPA: hypothetical protein EYP69_01300 [Bacteroidales bacterium]|nr:hypothetical protein [Bacteroidales bacterium]
MKTLGYFLVWFLVITNVVLAQTDTANGKPNVTIKVDVQRDANGNIISYDSTYVKTWSFNGQDIINDSLIRSLFSSFEHDLTGFGSFDIPDFPFFIDSLTNQWFDFDFSKMHQEMIKEMKRMQDSFGFPIIPEDIHRKDDSIKKEKTALKTKKI